VTLHGRVLLASASELSVRLWTIQGQFLCLFGQPDLWTHLGLLENAPFVVNKAPKRSVAAGAKPSIAESLVMELSAYSMQSVHDRPSSPILYTVPSRCILCAFRSINAAT